MYVYDKGKSKNLDSVFTPTTLLTLNMLSINIFNSSECFQHSYYGASLPSVFPELTLFQHTLLWMELCL